MTENGDLDPLRSRYTQTMSAEPLDEGRYCVFALIQSPGSGVVSSPRNAIATPEDEDRAASVMTSPQLSAVCAGGTVVTLTNTLDGTRENGAFYVLLSN